MLLDSSKTAGFLHKIFYFEQFLLAPLAEHPSLSHAVESILRIEPMRFVVALSLVYCHSMSSVGTVVVLFSVGFHLI